MIILPLNDNASIWVRWLVRIFPKPVAFVYLQACEDSKEVAIVNVEDLWQNVQGPTSLAELALEQKPANLELVEHHFSLCVMLHAILNFNMKSVRPLSLFDSKVWLNLVCYVYDFNACLFLSVWQSFCTIIKNIFIEDT